MEWVRLNVRYNLIERLYWGECRVKGVLVGDVARDLSTLKALLRAQIFKRTRTSAMTYTFRVYYLDGKYSHRLKK